MNGLRIAKYLCLVGALTALSLGTPCLAQTSAGKTIKVFDGRAYAPGPYTPPGGDAALVKEEVRRRSKESFLKKRLESLAGNFDEDFSYLGFASGAFTRAGSKQTAYLYRYSYTQGVVIAENGKVVAHYSGDPGDYATYTTIAALPDLNGNGFSEMLLTRNVEDTLDIFAYIFDLQGKKMTFWGQTDIFSSNVQPGEDAVPVGKEEDTTYLLSARPGPKPAFFRETYRRLGEGPWKSVKPAQATTLVQRGEASLTRIDAP